jgi:predicted amidohydrolase
LTGAAAGTDPTSEIYGSPAGELGEGVLPGNLSVPTFDTDFGRVAILICWDFDFPEVGTRASPKKSSPKATLNRRTLYKKSQKIPISSPRLVSPITLGSALF